MIFLDLNLKGAYIIEPEPIADSRGSFARAFCVIEFERRGLNASVAQCNYSCNHSKGTLRGMHYQVAPYEEAKLVRCTSGAIYDVIIDLRPTSSTYCGWFGLELSADNHRMLYVPEGFAHGYLSLTDNAEVFYQVSQSYVKEAERGVRWNDPRFQVKWPTTPRVISAKDASHPDFIP